MAAELALTRPDPTMSEDALRVMMAAAQRYVASGLLPAEVNTPQKALVVMTAGREMGVPATYALRNIHVVKGKPVCSAELLLALVRRTYGPSAIRVAKTSNTACTVQYREQGWDGISEYTFTLEDAKQAGVTGNNTWKNYPAAMLRARCISAVVRFAFPECIAGLYTPEEMGADVTVDGDGEVRIVEGEVVELPAADAATATLEQRAEFERNWKRGTAAAIACGVGVPETPPADATNATLRATLKELSEDVRVRKALNEELTAKLAQVNAAQPGAVNDVDPATCTAQEVHEMLATLNEMLGAVADDADAPF